MNDTTRQLDLLAMEASLAADMSRRGFLCSLGALALSACGGAEPGAAAASTAPTARSMAATDQAGAFAHPGLLHTDADFARMAAMVTSSPWNGSWTLLINNSHASLSYKPSPQAIVYRGADGVHPENYSKLYNDVAAAYACALRWRISGQAAYADKAVQIMNAWSSTLTAIAGTSDRYLAAGIYGYEFANAAEIVRTYPGWAAADFARFQNMMRTVFYPMNHDFLVRHNDADITHYWANWDLCNIASMLATGVLCDDAGIFDEAVTYFKEGAGNGAIAQAVYYVHPGYLGQWQETGRDQGHNLLGIGLAGSICEMAWNQGVDLYGHDNNRFLMGAEYVAKANLIASGTTYYTVPYVPYNNVDKVNQTVLSTIGQGGPRPIWALVYNHYVNRKGLAAPWSQRFAVVVQPEGGGGNYGPNSGGYDHLGYGTLTCTRAPGQAAATPSGLSAQVSGNAVVLSWWGCAQATGYSVKRSAASGGAYTVIASGITDLLTWSDTPPTAGAWYYVVTADLPGGPSAPSNEASAITGVRLHTRLPFDDGAGTAALDASGNGHGGVLAGGASWAAGTRAGAVALDGISGLVGLPAHILAGLGDCTIAAWVYWNAARTGERVFDFGAGTGRYMMLTARAASGKARFAMTVNGPYGEVGIDADAALPVGQWVHVAVTLSGLTGTLYVNGVPAGSNNALFLAPFRIEPTTQNWIGRPQAATGPCFNGSVDDFRIYHGALGQDAIVALMNGPRDLTGTVKLTQQGAVFNRATQKYVGAVTVTNPGAALDGPFQLKLAGLEGGITLDNASGVDAGAPYVTVAGPLAAGATLSIPLTFTNPGRLPVGYTPTFYQGTW